MAIQTLRMAGIKVWMITGDKMETAINIGVSCRLVTEKENLLILQAEHHFGEWVKYTITTSGAEKGWLI